MYADLYAIKRPVYHFSYDLFFRYFDQGKLQLRCVLMPNKTIHICFIVAGMPIG